MLKTYLQNISEAKAKKPARTGIAQEVYKIFASKSKNDAFRKFVAAIPSGLPMTAANNAFNNASESEIKNVVPLLSSIKSPESMNTDLNHYFKLPFLEKLFNADNKGIGKGELLLAFLIQNSKINGGSESFDLKAGGKKYEVKEYMSKGQQKASIRLGVEGRANKFKFWNQIIKTLTLVNKFKKYLEEVKELKSLVQYITDRAGNTRSGEFNKTDMKRYEEFYIVANKLMKKGEFSDDYTQTTFRGPNLKPKVVNIKPLDDDIVDEKQKLTLNKSDKTETEDNDSSLAIQLNRLEYVRNPKNLQKDLKKAIKKLVGTLIFIIFRSDTMNLTTDFSYSAISQGGIKIIETSLLKKN